MFAKSRYIAEIIRRDIFKRTKGKSRVRTGYIQKALLRQFLSAPYPKAKLQTGVLK